MNCEGPGILVLVLVHYICDGDRVVVYTMGPILWVVDVLMSSVEGVGSEDCRRRQREPQKRERRADIKPAGSLAQAVHHNAAWMHATDTYWRLVSSTGYQ